MERVTQKDIADALGLSLITVQRALNNSGYVSAELRERIADYVREVHYVPHKASQVLKRNRTRRLALFSSTEPAYFWEDIRSGVETAAEHIRPFDYRVDFFQVRENSCDEFVGLLEEAIAEGLDGVGFANKWLGALPRVEALLTSAGLPFVTFNVDAPDSGRLCHIGADDRAGGRLAADYFSKVLYFREAPRILVVATEPGKDAGERIDLDAFRLEGFLDAIGTRLPGAELRLARLPLALGQAEATRTLETILGSQAEAPDGIYLIAAYNPAFISILERLGLDRSYSVLHDLDKSALHYLGNHPLMAVICQNPILQGYDAVRSLERILETGGLSGDKIEIVHSLVFDENKAHYSNARLAAADSGFDG
ncbi:MAG TPA: LacI family DNA-binding transcriptional regulator [Rectinemataceae bacterium]|nr:LacI family DNA-binding transcriptional regulator [Rectinemataceae bacterium]